MLICLIGIGVIAVFWLIFLYNYICDKLMDKYDELSSKYSQDTEKSALYYKKYKFWRDAGFWFIDDSRNCAIIVSIILIIIYGIVFAGMKGTAHQNYKIASDSKSQIEYVLENNTAVDEDKAALIVKAIEINNQIRYYKRIQNNIWVNWFGYDDFATMEEIDLNDFS